MWKALSKESDGPVCLRLWRLRLSRRFVLYAQPASPQREHGGLEVSRRQPGVRRSSRPHSFTLYRYNHRSI